VISVSCGSELDGSHRFACAELVLRLPSMNASRNQKSLKDYRLTKEKANLISQTGLYLMPATTYSPTHFRVQYNRPCGA
jgi:hypothetical protein